jgi:hypothetical protein
VIVRENKGICDGLRIMCAHEMLMHCSEVFERVDLNYTQFQVEPHEMHT